MDQCGRSLLRRFLGIESLKLLGLSRTKQAAVGSDEDDGFTETSLQNHRGREMHRIVCPKRMALDQLTGYGEEIVAKLNMQVGRPIAFDLLACEPIALLGEPSFAPFPGEARIQLGVCDLGRRSRDFATDELVDQRRALLGGESFDEGAGIEVIH